MAGSLVDYEAVVADFEAFLVEDGRASHGTDFLTRKLTELRAHHRISESEDRRVLRRLGPRIVEAVLGLVPIATDRPLTDDDRETPSAMDAGATQPMIGGDHDGRRTDAGHRDGHRDGALTG